MPCSDVEDTRVGLQYVYPPQQASGLTIDPSLFETSFLGQPSNVSVHVEAGVGIAGTYYGFVEDHLSRGLGEPLPILSDRGQSTTAWSLATHYETSAMICPPSAVSEDVSWQASPSEMGVHVRSLPWTKSVQVHTWVLTPTLSMHQVEFDLFTLHPALLHGAMQ